MCNNTISYFVNPEVMDKKNKSFNKPRLEREVHLNFLLSLPTYTVASFPNADVTHTDGKIEVLCHGVCTFSDGEKNKTWTCEEQIPQEHAGCICPSELKGLYYTLHRHLFCIYIINIYFFHCFIILFILRVQLG